MGSSKKHNSAPILEDCLAKLRELVRRARRADATSLEAYRQAGIVLREIKTVCAHGEFGHTVKSVGMDRAWAARLMKLSGQWDAFQAALVWANERDAPVLFSVDGALRLIRDHAASKAPKRPNRKKRAVGSANLDQKLAAMKARNEYLEDALKPSINAPRLPLDDDTKQKVRKVGQYWFRGATAGERISAVSRIEAIAKRIGWSFVDLTSACGFDL